MPATAYHGQVHTEHAALFHHNHDIDVLALAAFDVLFVLYLTQGLNLVAINGGLLESKFAGGLIHGLTQSPDNLLLPSLQEHRRHLHILCVNLRGDKIDAGSGAALDLVQQARPRAVVEHRIFAGAQAEHPLQKIDALAHGKR